MRSSSDIKNPGRPKTGQGTPVLVRLQADLLAELDGYIEWKFEGLGRPEAIRRIIAATVGSEEE